MKSIKNILAIVDPTATTQPAVDKAAALAKKTGAQLQLFICDYRSGLAAPEAEGARNLLLDHRRTVLESIAAPIRAIGVEVTIDVAFAHPLHEGLLKKIAASHADLIVKDTHYHNLIRRTLVTNTDWHLIRYCTAPLLLVKPAHWSGTPRVLAAIDPRHVDDKPAVLDHSICEWSATLAQALQGEAHATHMYFPTALLISSAAATGLPMSVATGAEQELIEVERQTCLKQVQAITTRYGIRTEHTRLVLGNAVDQLSEEAERARADIVVMGAVARGALKRAIVGHTAERVLDQLPCDVLIVKPLDFATDLPF